MITNTAVCPPYTITRVSSRRHAGQRNLAGALPENPASAVPAMVMMVPSGSIRRMRALSRSTRGARGREPARAHPDGHQPPHDSARTLAGRPPLLAA
jgi:hypothetical protein